MDNPGANPPATADDLRIVPAPGGPVVETSVRVRFAETDAMGVVYHTNYVIWFEVGRGAYWRAMGLDREATLQDAGAFPVSAAEARYHAPARYGDLVLVRTRVEALRSRSLTFAYECVAAGGTLLATGRTTHLFLDDQGHARRLPEVLRRALTGGGVA